MFAATAFPVINAGISFSQMNCEDDTVLEVVRSMTRITMLRSVKHVDTEPENARTVMVAPSDKAAVGVNVATVEVAPCAKPFTKN